jgi:hypothetical protein
MKVVTADNTEVTVGKETDQQNYYHLQPVHAAL